MSAPSAPERRRAVKRGNGEGTIAPRRDKETGRVIGYTAAVSLDGGKRQFFYGKTRKDVAAKLSAALQAKQQGLPVAAPRTTVGAWLDYWLEQVVRAEREPTTYEGYEIAVRRYLRPYLGSTALAKLQPEDVERMLRDMAAKGAGARTQQVALARLRTSLNLALRRGHIFRNVATLVDMPKSVQRKHSPPDVGDLRRLLDSIREDRHRGVIVAGLALGLRRGEALGLRWEDVDFDAATATVRARVSRVRHLGLIVREGAKTASGVRTVVLPPLVVDAFRSQWAQQLGDRLHAGPLWKGPEYTAGKPTGYVFTSTLGTVLEPRNVNRAFTQACQQAGLAGRTFHSLRHDFASLMLLTGAQDRTVMQLMGHSNYALTANRYQHVPDALQRDAAARLNALLTGTG